MILEKMMMLCGHHKECMIIYQAKNKINSKVYIGKTIRTLRERKLQHYNDAFNKRIQHYFHRAIRKYGKDNFEWIIICECNNEKELNENEIYYIKELNSFGENGYNMTLGGEGFASGKEHPFYGKNLSEDHCKNISKGKIGKYCGKDNHFFGKHHTEESKEQNRIKHLGKNIGNENPMIIYNIDFNGDKNPFYGKHHTKESKNQISKTKSNMWSIITPSGKEFTFKGLSRFCKENNLNYSGVKSAFLNKRVYKNGWFFKKLILKGNLECLS